MAEQMTLRARATAHGGQDGRVRSEDGALDLALSPMDGSGQGPQAGSTPEQLLAAGYAACFLASLRLAARGQDRALPEATEVSAEVEVRSREGGRFGVSVSVQASLGDLPQEDARALIEAAGRAWPYAEADLGGGAIQVAPAARAPAPTDGGRPDADDPTLRAREEASRGGYS